MAAKQTKQSKLRVGESSLTIQIDSESEEENADHGNVDLDDSFDTSKRRSVVWQFFTIKTAESSDATCKMCRKDVSRGQKTKASSTNGDVKRIKSQLTTSGMIHHLEKYHLTPYENAKKAQEAKKSKEQVPTNVDAAPPKHQVPLTRFSKWSPSHEKAKTITDAITDMVALDNVPLRITEKIGFRRLMAIAAPNYELADRHAITKNLNDRCDNIRDNIREELKTATAVNITCDIWSSRNTGSYLGVTAHFWLVDSDGSFQHRFRVLSVLPIFDSHTGINIQSHLSEVFKLYKIDGKINMIIRDGASNMVVAMRLGEIDGWRTLHCTAHVLALITNDAVFSQRVVIDACAKIRAVATHLHRSCAGNVMMRAMCDKVGVAFRVLPLDVVTRWNSTYLMLEATIAIKEAVILYVAEREMNALTCNEWNIVACLLVLLKPFYEATVTVSGREAILGKLLDTIDTLKEDVEQAPAQGVVTTKEALLEAIKKRTSAMYCNDDVLIATLLNPGTKDICLTDAQTKKAKDLVIHKCAMLSEEPSSPEPNAQAPNPTPSTSAPACLSFEEKMKKRRIQKQAEKYQNRLSDDQDENSRYLIDVNEYISEPIVELKPSLYWSNKASRWPILAKVASMYESSPSSSVDSERVFSAAALIDTPLRNRTSSDNLHDLVFLRMNLLENIKNTVKGLLKT